MAIYDYSSGGFPASPATDDTLAMNGTTYKFNGSAWEVQTGGTTSYVYTATSGQTAFTGSDSNSKTLAYSAGNTHVFLNGVLLDAADYTATDGTTVTLGTGASTGDTLQIVAYGVLVSAGGGGGGAWEVISSTTLTSSATSVDFSLSGYSNFMLIMDGVIPANSSNVSVRFKFSKDGGSTYLSTTGDYHNTAVSVASNNSSGIFTSGNTDQGIVGNAYMHSTLPYRGQVHISVDDPTTAVFKMAGYVYNSTERYVTTGMVAVQTGTATHIRITDYAGTGFSDGTFTLYGIKTS